MSPQEYTHGVPLDSPLVLHLIPIVWGHNLEGRMTVNIKMLRIENSLIEENM